jgi:hypothetical protein
MEKFSLLNRQKTVFLTSSILGMLFAVIFIFVIITDNAYDDWVYASALFSLLLFIACIPTYIIYKKRSAYLEKIRSGEELYKEWTCSANEWQTFLKVRKRLKKKSNTGLYILVAVIGLIVGIGLTVAYQEALFLIITIGLILFLSIPAFVFPIIDNLMMPDYGHIVLARNGIYISGRLYNWNMASARLMDVEIMQEEGLTLICFVYRYVTLTIQGIDIVYVPLTAAMKPEAGKMISYYKGQIV